MADYVEINPHILNYARQIVQKDTNKVLDHFSKKSKQHFDLTKEKLKELETNKAPMDVNLLKEFACLYKRPLSFFFLPNPPVENFIPKDFRTHTSAKLSHDLSTETIFEIRKAKRVQYVTKEIFQDYYTNSESLEKHTLKEDPIVLAKKYREILGITTETQSKQKSTLNFFRLLRNNIEKLGILVYKGSFNVDDGRAFCFVQELPYLIVINNKDGTELGYAPKIFSLMHEFAHILLRQDSICNDFTTTSSPVEQFCNAFASNFLVPEDDFSVKIMSHALKTKEDIRNFCEDQKKFYNVSLDVILYRLKIKGVVTQNFIDETLKERKEKFDLSSDDPFIPLVTQAQKVINNQGQTFVQMVLEAKSSERITPEAAADYLNTKAKNLKSVESEIVRFYK